MDEVRAIRQLFFDFKKAPKGNVPRQAYLKQLQITGAIDMPSMRTLQRIDELGALGYQTIAGTGNILEADRKALGQYLRNSTYGTVLDLKFAALTFNEALRIPSMVSDLLSHEKLERDIVLTDAKVRNIEASTKRVESTTGDASKEDVFNNLDYENLTLLSKM